METLNFEDTPGKSSVKYIKGTDRFLRNGLLFFDITHNINFNYINIFNLLTFNE